MQGFELNLTDYILKPFEFKRFLIAVNKVKTARKELPVSAATEKDHIFINVQKKKIKLQFSDILYIESQKEYIKIVTTKNIYLSKMSTHEIETLPPPTQFKRMHRSYIVSVSKINSYTSEDVEVNRMWIPIGRGYKDAINEL